MNYTPLKIGRLIKAELLANTSLNTFITTLLIDSRIVSNAANALFFAIRTRRKDGHHYIAHAYQQGIRAFVIDSLVDIKQYPDAVFMKVPSVVKALQKLAATHRLRMPMPIVGITGSNGKTIVKEWIYQSLCYTKKIGRSPKSYNSQIGVPLSLWQLHAQDELALIEAGISQANEMATLQAVIQPNIGILTNVRKAHLQAFENRIQLAKEKLILFKDVDCLIYGADDSEIDQLIKSHFEADRLFSWGRAKSNHLQWLDSHQIGNVCQLHLRYKGEDFSFDLPFTDAASIENAMHLCAFLLQQGYNTSFIQARMPLLQEVEMRLEIKEALNQCTLINDAYSFDMDSLQIALDLLQQQKQYQQKVLILSEMPHQQLDKDFCKRLNAQLLDAEVNTFIAIGEAWSAFASCFAMVTYVYHNTEDFLQSHHLHMFYNECILLKGARHFGFERIAEFLAFQHHNTRLEIHLDRMLDNLHFFKSKLKADTRIMLMVKAFAYGGGSKEIAHFLQYHRADYLAVAYTDEGIRLRQAGIRLPIMVMNADEHNMSALIQNHLEPEVFSFHTLDAIEKLLPLLLPKEGKLALHIKLDTAMHRLGFVLSDLPLLIQRLKSNPKWYVRSVFTHLATSDMPEGDEFTQQQLVLFEQGSQALMAAFPQQSILRHVLNSAAIVRFPEHQYDMVRLGLGLYGFSSLVEVQKQLKSIYVLKTHISQLKWLKAGESVGYARAHICVQNTLVATVPIGYADGIHRYLGNGRYTMRIRGVQLPIIGNVCMDMCMLDVTALPDVMVGEEVVVFAQQADVEAMAAVGNTISYEVLTGISERVQRVYVRE